MKEAQERARGCAPCPRLSCTVGGSTPSSSLLRCRCWRCRPRHDARDGGGNTSSTPLHGPAARRSVRVLLQKRCARGNATPLFSIFHFERAQIVCKAKCVNPYALTFRRKHVAQARSSVRRLRGRLHLMRFVSRVGGPPGTMPASSERPLRDQTRPASELP